MTKVTITKIKDTPRVSKTSGKAFISRSILTNEYADKWLSGFKGKENEDWKEGDSVEIEIEQKGEYLNFTVPKTLKTPAGDINRVEMISRDILTQIRTIGAEITDIKGAIGGILQKIEPMDRIEDNQ